MADDIDRFLSIDVEEAASSLHGATITKIVLPKPSVPLGVN
jgi:hypothetical protein